MSRAASLMILGSVWAAAVFGGMAALTRYKLAPGAEAAVPTEWPKQSGLKPRPGVATLLVFVHPRCPCTKATTTELAGLLQKLGERVDARMVFIVPPGAPEDFLHGDIWQRASSIAGLALEVDRGGTEAARFGALTSGQTLLYAPTGALLFHGGLTIARGHEGESPGAERIAALVANRDALATAPVFGCELNDPKPSERTAP